MKGIEYEQSGNDPQLFEIIEEEEEAHMWKGQGFLEIERKNIKLGANQVKLWQSNHWDIMP